MEKALRQFGNVPFGYEVLLSLLKGYRRSNDKSVATMQSGLLEHHRINVEELLKIDRQLVLECCAARYKSRHLRVLVATLENM